MFYANPTTDDHVEKGYDTYCNEGFKGLACELKAFSLMAFSWMAFLSMDEESVAR